MSTMPAYVAVCYWCGSEFELAEGQLMKNCPACGTPHSRPAPEETVTEEEKKEREQEQKQFIYATGLRQSRRFSEAADCYQQVFNSHPDDFEAFWGFVLAQFGVEYLQEETCQVLTMLYPSAVPVRDMYEYQQALELATEDNKPTLRASYEEKAAVLDELRAAIMDEMATGKGYDVFLCHRTTSLDDPAENSAEYEGARELWETLRKMGYRVFFAPEDAIGDDVQRNAQMHHALRTARVMLVTCASMDHLKSAAVSSEYKYFFDLMDEDKATKRVVVPLLYGNLSAKKLPGRLAGCHMQAVNMTTMSAMNKIQHMLKLQGIEPEEIPEEEEEEGKNDSPYDTEDVEGGLCITKYHGEESKLTIPVSINGKNVVAIGSYAFEGNETLTKVVLPRQLRILGAGAFYSCPELKSVTLPLTLKVIGKDAFYGTELSGKLTVPAGVTNVGEGAFYGCNVTLCVRRDSAAYRYAINEGVEYTVLGGVPDPVPVPKPVPEPKPTPVRPDYVVEVEGNMVTLVRYQGKDVHVKVPAEVDGKRITCIGAYAFRDVATTMCSLMLPDDVRVLADHALQDCTALEALRLPKRLEKIGVSALQGCSSLRRLDCPACLRSIGEHAFSGCAALGDVEIPSPETTIGNGAFGNCHNVTLVVPEGSKAHRYATGRGISVRLKGAKPAPVPPTPPPTPQNADFEIKERGGEVCLERYRGNAERVEVPAVVNGKRITKINARAFSDVTTRMKHLVLPEGVRILDEYALQGCAALETLELPASLEKIGMCALQGCRALRRLTLPAGLHKVGDYALNNCVGLREVTVSGTTTTLGNGVFDGCSEVTIYAHRDSTAHTYAKANKCNFQPLGGPAAAKKPSPPDELPPPGARSIIEILGGSGTATTPPTGTTPADDDVPVINDRLMREMKAGAKRLEDIVGSGETPTPVRGKKGAVVAKDSDLVLRDGQSGVCSIERYTGKEKDLIIPDSVRGKQIVGIWDEAFKGCGLRSIQLPRGLRYISPKLVQNLKGVKVRVHRGSAAQQSCQKVKLACEVID